jgi:hypothetical protein
MSIKQQTQPSLFGMAASTLTNGLGMINNAFIAGERVTYIAASKASNLAEISDVADTLKLVVAKKELDEKCKELGVQVDAQGNMSF